jgi:hypothetical protein
MELRLTKNARLALIFLAYIILVLFVGLRWETGNDWTAYYSYYQHLSSREYDPGTFEIGYRFISFAIKSLGISYTGFLLLYAAIYIGLIFISFVSAGLEISGWLALGFYSFYLLGMMGTSRQAMAVAICLFSIRYVIAKKRLSFLLCIVMATAFHVSAICFLLTWPLASIRINTRYLWMALIVLAGISTLSPGTLVLESISNFSPNISFVEKFAALSVDPDAQELAAVSGNPALHLYIKTSIFLAFFLLGARYLKTDQEKLFLKLYFISCTIIAVLFNVNAVITMRLDLYFSIFSIFLLALYTRRLEKPVIRQLYCILLFFICAHAIWASVYSTNPLVVAPYKGVFINQDVIRRPGIF